jgi:hypothetical protein
LTPSGSTRSARITQRESWASHRSQNFEKHSTLRPARRPLRECAALIGARGNAPNPFMPVRSGRLPFFQKNFLKLAKWRLRRQFGH